MCINVRRKERWLHQNNLGVSETRIMFVSCLDMVACKSEEGNQIIRFKNRQCEFMRKRWDVNVINRET